MFTYVTSRRRTQIQVAASGIGFVGGESAASWIYGKDEEIFMMALAANQSRFFNLGK